MKNDEFEHDADFTNSGLPTFFKEVIQLNPSSFLVIHKHHKSTFFEIRPIPKTVAGKAKWHNSSYIKYIKLLISCYLSCVSFVVMFVNLTICHQRSNNTNE